MAPLIPFPGQIPWSDINPWKGLPSQTFKQYLSQLDAIIRLIVSGGASPRIILTSSITFFFDPAAGNDANDGLTSGTAKKTLANIWATITQKYDFAGQTVKIQTVGAPTITEQMNPLPWIGGGQVIFDGNGGTFNGARDALDVFSNLPGPLTVQNVTFAAANGDCILVAAVATVQLGPGVVFGVTPFRHMACIRIGASIVATTGYSITGAAAGAHVYTDSGGLIFIRQITINVAGGLAFGTGNQGFAVLFEISLIACNGTVFTGAGAPGGGAPATGQKFLVNSGACLFTGNSGTNFLPGTTGNFTISNGGIYV